MSDNETRQKLIDSAKKEFFENGFAKASLRKICTNAGVTTGALYFFFKNKDDLFSAIVAPPLLKLKEIPKPDDTCDALAIAICHTQAAGSQLRRVMYGKGL